MNWNRELLEYMLAQRRKIEIEKWCEGIRLKRDPGDEFVMQWIFNYGDWFRQSWNRSLCSHCALARKCGHEVRDRCDQFMKKNG